ncbi:hypothetical protein K0M31_003829 [Melipona bicolor]|uniref:Uncharacterized protein n=1 Tax=Melipona bicolor TaxID=60889 RepID=A0AA40FYG0_9HYME|nr:hypothetical protein K0M31_003829 [Melipona bicolor]
MGYNLDLLIFQRSSKLNKSQQQLAGSDFNTHRGSHSNSETIESQDLHSVDLEEFKHGGTNITAFRLVDPEKPEIQRVVQDWIYGEKRYNRELDMGQSSNKVRQNVSPDISY